MPVVVTWLREDCNMKKNGKLTRPREQPAVYTTIVGGRPPGSGTEVGAVPRGIEVLVKKASVDPEFRKVLIQSRDRAAREIELELDPAEAAMLQQIPGEQLNAIIDNTVVPPDSRRVFLGKVAALMLAAIGVTMLGQSCEEEDVVLGSRPDSTDQQDTTSPPDTIQPPPPTRGIQPDPPPDTTKPPMTLGIRPDPPPSDST